jgi:hypothetical protein
VSQRAELPCPQLIKKELSPCADDGMGRNFGLGRIQAVIEEGSGNQRPLGGVHASCVQS